MTKWRIEKGILLVGKTSWKMPIPKDVFKKVTRCTDAELAEIYPVIVEKKEDEKQAKGTKTT